MWRKLIQLIKGDKRLINSVFANQVLGNLLYSEETECWISDSVSRGLPFRFQIAGNWKSRFQIISPDSTLDAHAEDIALKADDFLRVVHEFLIAQIKGRRSLRWAEKEILELKVETIFLPWIDHPNKGMVLFEGPDEFRIWRCDYVNGAPAGQLAFDS